MYRHILASIAAVAALGMGVQAALAAPTPTDAEIRALLVQRIDVEHQGVGMVVGVIDAGGARRVIAYGRRDQGDSRPLDGDTVFEIGSMTKSFTALLLTEAVLKGEVKLDDPVALYLPAGTRVPERNGKVITLVDLATHTSGLPRLPTNLNPHDYRNPYVDYREADLYGFLAGYSLPRDIGVQFEYSNLGVGLLGHALARRAGESYAALVHDRITGPLGMSSTALVLTPSMKARASVGHNPRLESTPYWDMNVLAGAGGLRSTVNDMLTYVSAELGYTPTPLKPAMTAQLETHRPWDARRDVAMGWMISHLPTGDLVWHNGSTGGAKSFMGFNPATGVGVVILTNAQTEHGPDDIGARILTGATAPQPPKARTAIAMEGSKLDRFVGRYALTPELVLSVMRGGDHLFVQLTGQGANEIFPESDHDFFLKVVDAQLSFELGPDGRAAGVVLHQNGADRPAPRLP